MILRSIASPSQTSMLSVSVCRNHGAVPANCSGENSQVVRLVPFAINNVIVMIEQNHNCPIETCDTHNAKDKQRQNTRMTRNTGIFQNCAAPLRLSLSVQLAYFRVTSRIVCSVASPHVTWSDGSTTQTDDADSADLYLCVDQGHSKIR